MNGRLLTLSVLAFLGFYRHHPVTIEVRDAESGEPIRDAPRGCPLHPIHGSVCSPRFIGARLMETARPY